MSKNFDLAHELSLHYKGTYIKLKDKISEDFYIVFFDNIVKVHKYRVKLSLVLLDKDGRWKGSNFNYSVLLDDETNQNPNQNYELLFDYPIKNKCINTPKGTVHLISKLPKRQWLWGLCNSNTKSKNFNYLKEDYISSDSKDLLNGIFFQETPIFEKEIENIINKDKKASAISNEIIITHSEIRKTLFKLYYKQYRIGLINENLEAIISRKLSHLKNKLSMFNDIIYK